MIKLDISALRFDGLIAREWVAANGNGAYASSTLSNLNSRKYHGLLVAAMSPPVKRMVLLSRVEETVRCEGKTCDLASNEYPGAIFPQGQTLLRAFNSHPFPRWAYQCDGWTIEKQLRPVRGQNTVVLTYSLLGGELPIEMELRPLFALRGIHELMYQWNAPLDAQAITKRHHRIPATSRSPEVFFAHDGAFSAQPCWYLNTIYRREQERGYSGLEDLWMPGVVRWTLSPGQSVHFICSTEPIDLINTLAESERQVAVVGPLLASAGADENLEALLRAAEQFVVKSSDNLPMIMAGYPWTPPSARDAMIALPGLLLTTGRLEEAAELLSARAATVRDGLMPSDLTEDGSGWLYNSADASLWFINAVEEFLRHGGDEAFVGRVLLPVIDSIIDAYRRGTAIGVGVDEDDLVRAGVAGIPATWMDAKIGQWVITPRQGKPVELNALWYNALRIAASLNQRFGKPERGEDLLAAAHRTQQSFNRRFWNEQTGCCFDIVDDAGGDPSIRPNQIFAVSLPYPVLDLARHLAVIEKIAAELLTPFGLRTLSPSDPNYQGHYVGPTIARDRAYHQGSVFPWLLGPYISAYIKLHGRGEQTRREARKMLEGCFGYLHDQGVGQLCELFDGELPHKPGGAIASARSVAEVLRVYVADILDIAPTGIAPRAKMRPATPTSNRDPVKN